MKSKCVKLTVGGQRKDMNFENLILLNTNPSLTGRLWP